MNDSPDANVSLGLVQMLGKNQALSSDHSRTVRYPPLALYEPYREHVEYNLGEFDDETLAVA